MRELKYRHEYKYLIDERDVAFIQHNIKDIMKLDIHAEQNGSYLIRSIYFDDMYNTCYHQNESGVDPRAKYRIRIYNASSEQIFFERKLKRRGLTHKDTIKLTKEQSDSIIYTNPFSYDAVNLVKSVDFPVLQEFCLLRKMRGICAKTIVEYERIPYVYAQGNVRVTFDRMLSSSCDFDHFYDEYLFKRPVMPKGICILEVKYDEFFPSFIKKKLEIGKLRQTSFSKYYYCRKFESTKKCEVL